MIKERLAVATIIILLGSLTVFPGYAQQPAKIAAVDLQQTFERSVEGQNVLSQLKQKEQAIMSELGKYDQQILSLETKLRTQRFTLNEDAQQKLTFELETARIQRKRVEEDATKEFQRLQFTLVSRLRNEVLAVVGDYARELHISLVLDLSAPSGVVFCEPALDITTEIIRRYNSTKSANR
ncbi:MAG: OmpH family outer membrane protein [Candidatus Aminicenantes bacterium]|nr:OmpH family outer membrane protein [Candidatus Aminicenantes bacterium]